MGISTNTPHGQNDEYGGMAFDEKMDEGAFEQILVEGTVVRAIPGAYTVVCEFPGKGEQPTIYCPAYMSYMLGASSYEMPHEGTQVLAYCPESSPYAYVLAILPTIDSGVARDQEIEYDGRAGPPELEPEPGSDYLSVSAHEKVNKDESNYDHVQTDSGRPWNVLAGEWVRGNKWGVAVAVMHFHSIMQAGDGAKLEMSVFDDLVRLTSGTFEHNSAMGKSRTFDDEGALMFESTGSSRSPERLGEDYFAEVLTETDEATENSVAIDRPEIEPKDRYRMFAGALADLFQIYSRNAYDADTEDRSGDVRASVGYDGHVGVYSRAGISLGTKHRIPVPIRVKEPWDVDGDTTEGDSPVERLAKEQFRFDETYPYGRNLQMREALAWREKLTYQRFDEMQKDFTVNEHSEVQAPPEERDPEGSKYERKEEKNCGMDFNDDGSVRIYAGDGEEINMRGGCIIFSCPGNIEEHVGKSKVILAGQDLIFKARESVDVHATSKDLRLTSGGLLHAHAKNKGILVTTDSAGLSIDGGSEGEDVGARGIVIGKAENDVAIVGKQVTLVAEDDVRLKGKNLVLAATSRIVQAARNVFIEAGGGSALKMSSAYCSVIGRAVSLIAGGAMNFFRGDYALNAQWTSMDTPPPYDNQLPSLQELNGRYQESEEWLGDLDESGRQEIRYTYRTPVQYGTDKASETGDGASEFAVYQPLWQLLEEPTTTWEEEEIEGTWPWPGAGVRDSAFLTYEEGGNVDDDGAPANRSNMAPSGGSFKKGSMDDYGANA